MSSDTQNGFAFLEALSEDVFVESLGRNFDGESAHTRMKVRPSINGNMPSALQLLPGQSFYVGRITLSLVPEEHSNFPIHSSELPDSNFESYNYQVSQINTPHRPVRVDSTAIESPKQHRDRGSNISTPVLHQMSRQSISGMKDGNKLPESPLKREIIRKVRDVREHGTSASQRELQREDERMSDAATDGPSHSSPQPQVKIEDESMAHAITAESTGEGTIDHEDRGMEGSEMRSKFLQKPDFVPEDPHEGRSESSGSSSVLEKSTPVSPSGIQVFIREEVRTFRKSPNLAGLRHVSTCVARAQPTRKPDTLAPTPFLQTRSGSMSPQVDDDLEDAPVRKKPRTANVLQDALDEEGQDSLQSEIAVKRATVTPSDRPVTINQLSKTDPALPVDTESSWNPTNQSMTESDPSSAEPEHVTHKVDPSSSTRSRRSTARDERKSTASTHTEHRIVFASSSSTGDSKTFLKFLTSKGVQKVKSVHDCSILCIGKELKKTSKFILAVLLGKDVITDSWVIDSVRAKELLGFESYMARDADKEAEWGISLDEAISRGKKGGLKVFHDHAVLFTPSAKKEVGKTGFEELGEIAKCAGATSVTSALPRKSPEEAARTVVVGTQNRAEMTELQKGWRVYFKDIISLSVLRGRLDLDSDEFLIKEHKGEESRKRKR